MSRPLAGLVPASLIALTLLGAATGARAAADPPAADRYGPAPLADAYAPRPGPAASTYAPSSRETARAAPPRMLSWPGKASAFAPQGAETPALPPAQAWNTPAPTAPRGYASPVYPPPAYAPQPAAAAAPVVSPTFSAAPSAPSRAAPPVPYFGAPTPNTPAPASTSLAGPLAAAPAAATSGQHARLYSVHRAYGMQPDPAPIPPQFFAQTADLSAPATPDPIPNRAANAATRNAVNAARLAATEAN